jgi:hypothetical protein
MQTESSKEGRPPLSASSLLLDSTDTSRLNGAWESAAVSWLSWGCLASYKSTRVQRVQRVYNGLGLYSLEQYPVSVRLSRSIHVSVSVTPRATVAGAFSV